MKLTVVIPVYNQLELCRECLNTLDLQTCRDFSVVLLDDCSTQDYSSLVSEFANLNIVYKRNPQNLGAIQNIFQSIFYKVDSIYLMSMHEDDLLHPEYIQRALAVLDQNSSIAFVASNTKFFDESKDLVSTSKQLDIQDGYSAQELTRLFLRGESVMLASVVYRVSALASASQPNLELFSTACDRPFLVELAKKGGCVVFLNKIFYSRRHGLVDMRSNKLNWQNLFALYEYYRNQLAEIDSKSDPQLLLQAATNDLIWSYHNLLKGNRPSLVQYVRHARTRGLFAFLHLRTKGYFGFLAILLGNHISFMLAGLVKKLQVSTEYKKVSIRA